MSLLLLIVALIVVAILLAVAYFIVSVLLAQNYWKKRNVYTLRTRVPILGHMANIFKRNCSVTGVVLDFYKELKDQGKDFGGIYTLKKGSLIIIDPKLIGEATIKQFDHFVNRRPIVDQSVDRLIGRSLLGLQNEEWRSMRHHLSPAFTGSKLRGMIGLVETICDKFSNFLTSRPDHNEPLDLYFSFRRMAADVIASTAFGVHSNSISDPEADFYKNGIKMMDFSGRRTAIMMGYFIFPALMKLLNIPFVPKSLSTFFQNKITSNIEYREKENKSRADMIQLLLDARKADPDNYIDDSDITSQAFTFFLGGFDTMATTFSFLSHRLALQPEIQTKVRDEVKEVMEQNNGKLTYESLKDLKYMDMVIAEVLRMHPPLPMMDRMCCKNVDFPDHGIQIEEGTSIMIPVFGLHFDPDYFPDPDKFDPERFSEENKSKIKPFTYLPFGEGPRNCIGKRFALLELKLGLSKILSKHELLVCEKTNVKVPFEYKNSVAVLQPAGGFWLNIKPISEE